jgi:hypothetical protein
VYGIDESTETAIVNYHLWFADQGKQISAFHFRFQQTNGSLSFQFSVSSILHLQNCRIPETWRHGHGENESLGDLSKSVLRLLIVQPEVCRFSVG